MIKTLWKLLVQHLTCRKHLDMTIDKDNYILNGFVDDQLRVSLFMYAMKESSVLAEKCRLSTAYPELNKWELRTV